MLALSTAIAPVVWNTAEAVFTASTTSTGNSVATTTFPTYPTEVAANGPWAYYRGEDNQSAAATSVAANTSGAAGSGTYDDPTAGPSTWWKFDENGGTTALDSSGAANTGTVSAGAAPATGRSGSALAFDNTGDIVTGQRPATSTNASFSVVAWAKLGAKGTANRTLVSQDGAYLSGFYLHWNYSSDQWTLSMFGPDAASPPNDAYAGNTATVNTNTWYHLVGVYDSTTQQARMYVNGSPGTAVGVTGAWNATGPLVVGRGKWGGPVDQFNGVVDEVRVYGRVLSGAEITSLYNSTFTEVGMTAKIIGALQGPQQNLEDSSGIAFAGLANAYRGGTTVNPTTFTLECWFRVGPGQFGPLIGLASTTNTYTGTTTDKVLYIDSGGRLSFAVKPTTPVTLRTTARFDDSTWHYVAASVGAGGTRLYVDGEPALSDPSTASMSLAGYWRWGGIQMTGLPNAPANDRLVGTLDEVAIYPTQLSDQQVAWNYYANH